MIQRENQTRYGTIADLLSACGPPRDQLEKAASRPTLLANSYGQAVVTPAIDRAEITRYLRHRAAGRNAYLRPFYRWLQGAEGLAARTARDCVSEVGSAIADTAGHPQLKVANISLNLKYCRRLRRWLELITRHFLGVEYLDPSIAEWAQAQRDILGLQAPPRPVYEDDEDTPRGPRILTDEEENCLVEKVDDCRSFGYPHPWTWAVLRLLMGSGANISEIVWVRRANVERALAGFQRGKRLETLEIPRCRTGSRFVPVVLLEPAVESLLGLRQPWEHIADIVAPLSPVSNRFRRAAELIGRDLHDVCEDAGIQWDRYTVAALRACHMRMLRRMCIHKPELEDALSAACLIDTRKLRPRRNDEVWSRK